MHGVKRTIEYNKLAYEDRELWIIYCECTNRFIERSIRIFYINLKAYFLLV